MDKNRSNLSHSAAEEIAIKALGFLSSDPELFSRFLGLSGLDPSSIREIATEPSFLVAILDFLTSDDSLILAFASNEGFAPEDVMLAKFRLDPMSRATTGAL